MLTAREPFYRTGADFSFNYHNLNIYGLYMYGHDNNQLPVDITGTPVPLPISSTSPAPVGFVHGQAATFSGGFVQADYLALPWIMAIMRWDAVNSAQDRINGLGLSTSAPAPSLTPSRRFWPRLRVNIVP